MAERQKRREEFEKELLDKREQAEKMIKEKLEKVERDVSAKREQVSKELSEAEQVRNIEGFHLPACILLRIHLSIEIN